MDDSLHWGAATERRFRDRLHKILTIDTPAHATDLTVYEEMTFALAEEEEEEDDVVPMMPTPPRSPQPPGKEESVRADIFRRTREALGPLAARSGQRVLDVRDGRTVLRNPLGAVPVNNQPRTIQSQPKPRWPTIMAMSWPPPVHITATPPQREPYHTNIPQRKVPTKDAIPSYGFPKVVRLDLSGTLGRVIYLNELKPSAWLFDTTIQSSTETAFTLPPTYTPTSSEDATLVFDSRFESGNLEKAVQLTRFEYQLFLRTDIYTSRHTQWFYFRVSNTRKGIPYKFSIANFLKNSSLYSYGMRLLCYSTERAKTGEGWYRTGENIQYNRTDAVHSVEGKLTRYFHTLSWDQTFDHDNDTVYFAYCYPYTYTDLQNYLTALSVDQMRSKVCRLRILCKTLAGNNCDLLTITNFDSDQESIRSRKGIVLTARIHPGESNSSWMMKGVIDFLTGPDPDAEILRESFVFKIVPMMNPDGVIVGNYRSSLAGVDLNRVFRNPVRELFPCVFHVKTLLKRFKEDRPIVLYCDFHGHSKKQNVFIYGCLTPPKSAEYLHERVFPKMLSLNAPNMFSFKNCRFNLDRAKDSTGRVTTFTQFGILNAMTMEASFAGATIGEHPSTHFSIQDFESMGAAFLDTILDYCDPDQSKTKQLLQLLLQKPATQVDNAGEEDGDDENEEEDDDEIGSDSENSDSESNAVQKRFSVLCPTATSYEQQQPPAPIKKARPITKAKLAKQKAKEAAQAAKTPLASEPQVAATESELLDANAKPQLPRVKFHRSASARQLISKYENANGNGFPTFTEERITERSKKLEARVVSTNTVSVAVLKSTNPIQLFPGEVAPVRGGLLRKNSLPTTIDVTHSIGFGTSIPVEDPVESNRRGKISPSTQGPAVPSYMTTEFIRQVSLAKRPAVLPESVSDSESMYVSRQRAASQNVSATTRLRAQEAHLGFEIIDQQFQSAPVTTLSLDDLTIPAIKPARRSDSLSNWSAMAAETKAAEMSRFSADNHRLLFDYQGRFGSDSARAVDPFGARSGSEWIREGQPAARESLPTARDSVPTSVSQSPRLEGSPRPAHRSRTGSNTMLNRPKF
eukprot:m.348044 g.348044  ORF g.348044 m.348044 type:complete len:1083 (-) comp55863_c0_seq1:70-3318(-)